MHIYYLKSELDNQTTRQPEIQRTHLAVKNNSSRNKWNCRALSCSWIGANIQIRVIQKHWCIRKLKKGWWNFAWICTSSLFCAEIFCSLFFFVAGKNQIYRPLLWRIFYQLVFSKFVQFIGACQLIWCCCCCWWCFYFFLFFFFPLTSAQA